MKKMNRIKLQPILKKPVKTQDSIEEEHCVEVIDENIEEEQEQMLDIEFCEEKEEMARQSEDDKKEYCKTILHRLIEIGEKNIDLVKFSYFLRYSGYSKLASPGEQNDWDNVVEVMRVLFCHIPSNRTDHGIQSSRLFQCYLMNLFSDDYYYKNSFSISSISNNVDSCENCVLQEEQLAFCPYSFECCVEYISNILNIDAYDIYVSILGNNFPPLQQLILEQNGLPKSVLSETSHLDSKSSRTAYLILVFHFLEVSSYTADIITYKYIPLCNRHDKKSVIKRIINFWNGKGGEEASMPAFNVSALDECKPMCEDCEFKQCPFQLAAYYTVLGKSIGISPVRISYEVACRNTVSNLNAQQNYQYEKYYEHAKEMPYTPDSFQEYIKIIKYIINRSQNPKAPLLPLNIILYTNDEQQADVFFDDFQNCLWYFEYFGKGSATQMDILYIATLPIEELIKKYESASSGTVFHIKQYELLCNSGNLEIQIPKLCKIMKERKDVSTVISGEKVKLNEFFSKFPELYYRIFTYHLYTTRLSATAVFKLVREKLELDYEMDEVVVNLIRDYIYSEYEKSELEGNSYAEWFCNKIIFNHFNDELGVTNILRTRDIPCITPKRNEEEIFDELNSLIGLNNVKEILKNMYVYSKYLIKTKKEHSQKGMHMVFTGSAGTGKTTVAKLVAEILYNIGYIKQNKLIICSGKDLIGEYIGVSQQKTARKCEEAYGGVLFIDEAYQLDGYTSGSYADTYKLDAVNELIQQMENNRSRLTVIFAGYTEEMNLFIKRANTGLQSRISYIIPFPDYTEPELMQIFKKMVNKEGLKLSNSAEMKVASCIHSAIKQGQAFGNARFCRNLFEHSEIIHARNVCNLELNDPRLYLLTEEDIVQM